MPPLTDKTYDEPGSWGRLSEGWPELISATPELTTRAFVACSLEGVVPYGSYVRIDDYTLRIETAALMGKLVEHLNTTPLTTEQLIQRLSSKD